MLAHGRAAGEHQMIEGQGTECPANVGITLHHHQFMRGKVVRYQLSQQVRSAWCQLRGFEHGGITGSKYPGQRPECQVDGKIPRTDDADHPQGLLLDTGLDTWRTSVYHFRAYPLTQVFGSMLQALDGGDHVHQQGLILTAVGKVGADGIGQCLMVFLDQPHAAQQAVTS